MLPLRELYQVGRVGTKRSDRRWKDDKGNIWASEYESIVYYALVSEFGTDRVFRCNEGKDHTFDYTTEVKGGECVECSSRKVVQRRTYTPDLYIISYAKGTSDESGRTYIETKGYFSAQKRSLLRAFRKTRPDIDLYIILQRDGKAKGTKRTYGQYIDSYLKVSWCAWNPKNRPTMPDSLFDFFRE